MCGPHRRFAPLLSRTLRHIPRMVSAIAIFEKDLVHYAWEYAFRYRKR